jgi:hypothetical protein
VNRLSDGEKDILAEQERDARECEEGRRKATGHTPGKMGFSEGCDGNSEYAPDFPMVGPEDSDEAICWLETGLERESVVHANGERIAAAWNAVDGISTEALESGVVADLLAACLRFIEVNAYNGYEFESNEPEVYSAIFKALGKAKGTIP